MSTAPQKDPKKDWVASAMSFQWVGRVLHHRPGAVKLLRDATVEAQRSRLPQMAAALSYRTIFGLIPVMVVALIALKFFTTESDLTAAINKAMQYSGLSQIAVSDAPMGPFPEGEGPSAPLESSQRLDLWIQQLVARVSGFNFQAVGLIGVIALIYAAISMLVEVERAFNQIYCIPIGRSWLRRVVNYWFLLTVGTGALFSTFWIGQRFTGSVEAWATTNGGGRFILWLVGYLSTTAISTLLFILMYLVIPNTRVKVGPAAVGAFIAALAWEAGKWAFTEYLHNSTGYAKLYGSIALVPLFMLWVYVTWCIVLFGLNIAYFLEYGHRANVAKPVEAINPEVVEPGGAVALAVALARQFEKGEPSDPRSLGTRCGMQESIAVQVLDRMIHEGLAVKVRYKELDGFYALARPADRISAEAILDIGESLIVHGTDEPIADTMRNARHEAVRGKTLASFMAAPPTTPAAKPKPAVTA
jgi:YihY family inner membrane protein